MASARDDIYTNTAERLTKDDLEMLVKDLKQIEETQSESKDSGATKYINEVENLTWILLSNKQMDDYQDRLDVYEALLALLSDLPKPKESPCDPKTAKTFCKIIEEKFEKIADQLKKLFGNEETDKITEKMMQQIEDCDIKCAVETVEEVVTDSRSSFVKTTTQYQAAICSIECGVFCVNMWICQRQIKDLYHEMTGKTDNELEELQEQLDTLFEEVQKSQTMEKSTSFTALVYRIKSLHDRVQIVAERLLGLKKENHAKRNEHAWGAIMNGFETFNSYRWMKMSSDQLTGWWKVVSYAAPIIRGLMTVGHGVTAARYQLVLGEIDERLKKTDMLKKRIDKAAEEAEKLMIQVKKMQ